MISMDHYEIIPTIQKKSIIKKKKCMHINILLSSNASKVPFEYGPQYYFNKNGKACKARVNEWIINQI